MGSNAFQKEGKEHGKKVEKEGRANTRDRERQRIYNKPDAMTRLVALFQSLVPVPCHQGGRKDVGREDRKRERDKRRAKKDEGKNGEEWGEGRREEEGRDGGRGRGGKRRKGGRKRGKKAKTEEGGAVRRAKRRRERWEEKRRVKTGKGMGTLWQRNSMGEIQAVCTQGCLVAWHRRACQVTGVSGVPTIVCSWPPVALRGARGRE